MSAVCDCPSCTERDAVLEPLRRLVDRVEATHNAIEAILASDHPDPMLVTDATTGRYILLDSLVIVLEARLALVRATT